MIIPRCSCFDCSHPETMKVVTPEIAWHEREPIYSVDLQPLSGSGNLQRLASCGVDRVVRVRLGLGAV